MSFLQKIGNALSRFMYGRNGADQLGLTTIWAALLLDVVNIFIKQQTVHMVISFLSTVLLVIAVYRVFSRNLQKRRAENARFLEKVWWPMKRRAAGSKQQRMDKAHKYFTCHNCKTVCRVPRGKGKIVITCPKCGGEIRGKS